MAKKQSGTSNSIKEAFKDSKVKKQPKNRKQKERTPDEQAAQAIAEELALAADKYALKILDTGRSGDSFALDLARRASRQTGQGIKGDRKYNPDALWLVFLDYCEWMANNPAKIEKPFSSGVIALQTSNRPLTLNSFYLFAGIDHKTFTSYESDKDYVPFTARIRDTIFAQKFDGATRGEFDSNIIARDLGIGDRLDVAGLFDPLKPIKIEFGKGNSNIPKKQK